MKKTRLDVAIVEKGLLKNRQRARAFIMTGKVRVNDQIILKPGAFIHHEDNIVIKSADHPYVSRGGLKLAEAVRTFGICVSGFVCLDVGASTGGFTDCLLQHGASCVYAVDVGYGQLAWKLRQDPRVVVIERTNIRYMLRDALPQPVDLVTIDVSFISLRIVVPAVLKFLKRNARILALIKPQFEVSRGLVGKGGVVRDPALHVQIIDDLKDFFVKTDLICESFADSPILGTKGNKEFIIALKYAK
ncbi:TlyA family RNA methyltransferase [Thermodesulfobacteriota bacterium]